MELHLRMQTSVYKNKLKKAPRCEDETGGGMGEVGGMDRKANRRNGMSNF